MLPDRMTYEAPLGCQLHFELSMGRYGLQGVIRKERLEKKTILVPHVGVMVH
jgi:hypothetical protein